MTDTPIPPRPTDAAPRRWVKRVLSTTHEPGTDQQLDEPNTRGSAPRGSETILVAEDEDAVRTLVRDTLVASGYTVLEASSARQAIDVWRLHSASIALLLTDVVMPGGVNGFELADRLRLHDPGLRVIFTSGLPEDVRLATHTLVPGVNYLSKPYALVELIDIVRRALDTVPEG
jgi:CheY-like chemotaxis protein